MVEHRHIPPPPDADDRFNSRLGLWLFALYCATYGLFMVLAAFYPAAMALRIGGRVNLAITYGFGLIVFAGVLALVYLWCARGGKQLDPQEKA
jgi:uncharacterized membrane protein (DUF485 family)